MDQKHEQPEPLAAIVFAVMLILFGLGMLWLVRPVVQGGYITTKNTTAYTVHPLLTAGGTNNTLLPTQQGDQTST